MTYSLYKKIALLALLGIMIPAAVSAAPRESLFFTADELRSIMMANQGFLTIPSDEEEEEGAPVQEAPMDRGRRILKLSGLVYQSPSDWTVWLNGERVTPKNIPENVMGLVVRTDHIRLRWLDKATNRIVNITLRPHQQYNLDLDLISPGT